jgi:hypothetical protein
MEVFQSAVVATGLDEEMARELGSALMARYEDVKVDRFDFAVLRIRRGFRFTITQTNDETTFSIIAIDRSISRLETSTSLRDLKNWCDGYLAACERDDN